LENVNLKEKRKKYRDIALRTLQKSEFARNSDWCFLFDFLFHSHGIVIPKDIRGQIYKSRLNLRTIMRERQYLQNTEGLFPPTDPVILARRKNLQQQYTKEYSPNNN
jgi:hypothetical protein